MAAEESGERAFEDTKDAEGENTRRQRRKRNPGRKASRKKKNNEGSEDGGERRRVPIGVYEDRRRAKYQFTYTYIRTLSLER